MSDEDKSGGGAGEFKGGGNEDDKSGGESWRDGLSEDLRGNEVFANYGSLDDFAKGHIETKKAASGKAGLALPTDDASIKAFGDALRPENADAYKIDTVEGQPSEFADKFREKAFEQGWPPHVVSDIVGFNNEYVRAQLEKSNADSQAELDKFKGEFTGKYDEKLNGVKDMLKSFGVELSDDDWDNFDIKLGTGNLMKFMFETHSKIGDPDPLDDKDEQQFEGVKPEQADGKLTELMKDAEWRKQALVKGSTAFKQNAALQRLIARHRQQEGKN